MWPFQTYLLGYFFSKHNHATVLMDSSSKCELPISTENLQLRLATTTNPECKNFHVFKSTLWILSAYVLNWEKENLDLRKSISFFLNRHPLVVNTHVKSAKERSFHNYKMLPIAQQFNVLKRGLQLQACSVGRIWRRDGRFKGRVRRHYCMLMYAHAKKWACCV